jgi:RNA polymerase sigma factor (sigma-70 family)
LIRDKNISDRYIEQSEQTDTRLYKKGIYNSINIETIVYKKYIKDEINKAVSELKEIQARRLIMYYIEEKTYEEIAQIEGCTKRAVKFSVDAAKKNLQNKLKNLFLDYTNK